MGLESASGNADAAPSHFLACFSFPRQLCNAAVPSSSVACYLVPYHMSWFKVRSFHLFSLPTPHRFSIPSLACIPSLGVVVVNWTGWDSPLHVSPRSRLDWMGFPSARFPTISSGLDWIPRTRGWVFALLFPSGTGFRVTCSSVLRGKRGIRGSIRRHARGVWVRRGRGRDTHESEVKRKEDDRIEEGNDIERLPFFPRQEHETKHDEAQEEDEGKDGPEEKDLVHCKRCGRKKEQRGGAVEEEEDGSCPDQASQSRTLRKSIDRNSQESARESHALGQGVGSQPISF